jgi:hypothetical protein
VLFDESDVFDGLSEVPHSALSVPAVFVAVPHVAGPFLAGSDQRPAGRRTLYVGSEGSEAKVFAHSLVL